VKEPPWPVYDLFDADDGSKIFIAIVGDGQWVDFCKEFGRDDWLADPGLQTNADRAAQRAVLIPEIQAIVSAHPVAALCATFERLGLPFAPVRKPGDLVGDPHLQASGGLIDIALPDGTLAPIPALPMTFGGRRLGLTRQVPAVGDDTRDILAAAGLANDAIEKLLAQGIVRQAPPGTPVRDAVLDKNVA